LRVVIADAGNSSEPRGRCMSAAGSLYQKTGEDTAGCGDLNVCPSEL
jgi:hypothetical protein